MTVQSIILSLVPLSDGDKISLFENLQIINENATCKSLRY